MSSEVALSRPRSEHVPAVVRSYRVLRRLATGGTSDILLACGEGPGGFRRVVVLKALLPELAADARFTHMFWREAAAYARLSHPAIARLYDFFADGDRLVLVLEHIDGFTLSRVQSQLRSQGQRLEDAASLFIGWRIFSALSAAHSARDSLTGEFGPVMHLDVNPSNVIVPWDGQVKLVDFGAARVSGVEGDGADSALRGSHGYAAPEQMRGGPLTVRADVYAGCVLLWELLAGRRAMQPPAAHTEGGAAPLLPSFPALGTLRPDLPRILLGAIAGGLSTHPDTRALTAEDVCNVLRTVADLDEGRRALVGALSALKTPPTPEELAVTTSRSQTVDTPVTPSTREGPISASHRPVALSGAVQGPKVGVAFWATVLLAAILVCAGVVIGAMPRPREGAATVAVGGRPVASAASAETRAAPAPTAPSEPMAAPGPTSSAAASPAAGSEPTSGTITVPETRRGHRVWIDDHLVGEAPGRYEVSCGWHAVRVGSQGDLRRVQVACDADVTMP